MLFKNNQTTRWNQPLPLYLRIQHKFPWMYMINVFVPLIYLYLILCMNLFQLALSSFSFLAFFQFWHFFNFGIFFDFGIFLSLASFSVWHLSPCCYCSALTPLWYDLLTPTFNTKWMNFKVDFFEISGISKKKDKVDATLIFNFPSLLKCR